MLAQVDSLPGPQDGPAIADRYGHRTADHRRLDMRRHVVGPFQGMPERKVFASDQVEGCFQITGNIRISIFIDRQGRRRVQNENVHQADTHVLQFRHRRTDLVRDQVEPPGKRPQPDFSLNPCHDVTGENAAAGNSGEWTDRTLDTGREFIQWLPLSRRQAAGPAQPDRHDVRESATIGTTESEAGFATTDFGSSRGDRAAIMQTVDNRDVPPYRRTSFTACRNGRRRPYFSGLHFVSLSKSIQPDLRTAGCGVLMGAADIVPGVSGGTVALVLGIYHRLVTAISHIDGRAIRLLMQRQFREAADYLDLRFLVSLAVGIGGGIGGLAFLMHYLLEHQLQYTFAVFTGLILGSSILIGRSIAVWNGITLLSAATGTGIAWYVVGLDALQHPPESFWYLFTCGAIGISAMILPGISGSFILLILGRYDYVTGLVRSVLKGDLAVDTLAAVAVFGGGCLCGLLAFSRVLRWLLSRHTTVTLATLCGFMVGSLRKIWPFKRDLTPDITGFKLKEFENQWPAALDSETLATAVLAVIAFGLVVSLESVSRRARQTAGGAPAQS